MIAPFPALDVDERPLAFVALILAKTLVPQSSEKGLARKTETGITHWLAETIEL